MCISPVVSKGFGADVHSEILWGLWELKSVLPACTQFLVLEEHPN